MTATYQMSRDLGWEYFEKLAKQKVMQVQSAADPPKKLALGERAVMADGNEYNMFQLEGEGRAGRDRLRDRGHAAHRRPQRACSRTRPIRTPRGCSRASASRPRPSSSSIDVGGLRSVHPQVKEKPGPQAVQRDQDDEGRLRRRSRRERARSRRATASCSGCDAAVIARERRCSPRRGMRVLARARLMPASRMTADMPTDEDHAKHRFSRRDVLKLRPRWRRPSSPRRCARRRRQHRRSRRR